MELGRAGGRRLQCIKYVNIRLNRESPAIDFAREKQPSKRKRTLSAVKVSAHSFLRMGSNQYASPWTNGAVPQGR
jgi:hypothetical protein